MTAQRLAALAVDVGGSSLKGALVDVTGRSVRRETVPTPDDGGAAIDAIAALIGRLAEQARVDGLRLVGAGVVTPGTVDDTGTVAYASNLGWRNVPLARLLTERLGLPVSVGHDVRAAGLAEQLLGGASGERDFVYIAIGTGVAAALFSGGAVLPGAQRAAGEVGHVPVHPDGELCTCGQRGCLEVYMSGAGLSRRYLARTGRERSAKQIIARIGHDPDAAEVWGLGVRTLALGLATLTLTVDPSAIVLGGGISRAGQALLGPVRSELDRQLAWRSAPRLVTTALGTEAGRIGAAILAFRHAGVGDIVTSWPKADALIP
ncbi:MAG TPA: ROK family protein [Trebonia sp.]|nr:ROK family protein [Trebonia sp.]